MLSLKNRLKKGKDFNAVYKKGQSAFFEGIFVKFLKNGEKESRIGLSVGRKFSKKAVARNRIKRQLRAISRESLENLKKGFDMIIIPQKVEKEESYGKIKGKVLAALKRGNLIKN
jgi:ribonuclease P protein component